MGIMGIIIGILILSVMMVVHELGHFLTGRRLGFTIEEFSIFMGPVLFSWERKGIKYSIKLLPIGASVRFAGEMDDHANSEPGHFFNRPIRSRAAVIATGPALNLLSGILALFILFTSFGTTLPVISTVMPDTLAAGVDIATGDRILKINGTRVATTLDYSAATLFTGQDEPLVLQIEKEDGRRQDVTLEPKWRDVYRLGITVKTDQADILVIETVDPESNGGQPVLKPGDLILAADGVKSQDMAAFSAAVSASRGEPVDVEIVRDGVALTVTTSPTHYSDPVEAGIYFASTRRVDQALGQALSWSWSIVKVTFKSIGALIRGTVRAQDTLSGPVGVVTMISDVVTEARPLADKVYQLFWMFAIISITLGFMNLLPLPPLDGHHLVLLAIEAVRGKRLPDRIQNLIGMVGIALIVILALTALLFDIIRIAGR